ncbi:peptidyl-tRNA hydrolase Pth2 [Acidianus sp. HS-5]|uniref:peptidyl-tRNA hydrolase Pth2 n=1 Tax=Acidianus sp. HS-5 TaxID=2886040 RepID=UPI001F48E6BC|nr:peptidyl-tRNA hydrolase Pth2 [Acidianus sp. HS-5]
MKMVIVVRNDLKMGKGKIAAQVAHAAVSLVLEILNSSNNTWKSCLYEWINEGQPKIIVKVESLEELMKRAEIAKQKDLPVSIIQDAGRTQVEPGTITCAGIGPCEDSLIDSITGDLKLL